MARRSSGYESLRRRRSDALFVRSPWYHYALQGSGSRTLQWALQCVRTANGFANGATGRVVHWGPDYAKKGLPVKPVLANVPGVQLRFFHEASVTSNKAHFLPLVDFIDLEPRKESVPTAKGKPSMLQLQVQPAYGLTIHKYSR